MKFYLKVSVSCLSQLSFTIHLEIKQIRILLQSTNWLLPGVIISYCLSLMVWWINLINMSLQLRKWRLSPYLCSQCTCMYLVHRCRLLCILCYPFFALCKRSMVSSGKRKITNLVECVVYFFWGVLILVWYCITQILFFACTRIYFVSLEKFKRNFQICENR